jgi:hypothetical protein
LWTVLAGVSAWVMRGLPRRSLERLFALATAELDRRGPDWVTVHRRPKRAADHSGWLSGGPGGSAERTAVVIQGPLVEEDEFTLDTVRLYRRNLRDPLLVVSTWADAPVGTVAALRSEGAEVVLCEPPPKPGVLNVNYQVASTRAGIARARALGAAYALKVRADWRLHVPDFDRFFLDIHRLFPARSGTGQKGRIVVGAHGTSVALPYNLSDFAVFGTVDDMEAYWAAPLDPRDRTPDLRTDLRTVTTERRVPEVYLCAGYLERLGRPLAHTVADWWQVLADYFCVIDLSALDAFWVKHKYVEHRGLNYTQLTTFTNMTFCFWLQLHQGGTRAGALHERFLDCRFGDPLPATPDQAPAPAPPEVILPCHQ